MNHSVYTYPNRANAPFCTTHGSPVCCCQTMRWPKRAPRVHLLDYSPPPHSILFTSFLHCSGAMSNMQAPKARQGATTDTNNKEQRRLTQINHPLPGHDDRSPPLKCQVRAQPLQRPHRTICFPSRCFPALGAAFPPCESHPAGEQVTHLLRRAGWISPRSSLCSETGHSTPRMGWLNLYPNDIIPQRIRPHTSDDGLGWAG